MYAGVPRIASACDGVVSVAATGSASAPDRVARPKSSTLSLAVVRQADVARLEVTVHDAGGVGRGHGVAELERHGGDFVGRQAPRSSRCESDSPSTYSITMWVVSPRLDHVVDGGDVRVVERRGRSGLAQQRLARAGALERASERLLSATRR